MTDHLKLIARQLDHLKKMNEYLQYSYTRAKQFLPVANWQTLSPQQHEIFTAFRVRFSEFQEHLAKIMRAIAIEEEIDVDRFGSVLAFMEKLKILDSSKDHSIL